MARLMRMPEVAAGGTAAVLQDWQRGENAEFGADDVIATVETEKAVVDVEAEQAGVVLKLLVAPGSSVEVGAPIAVLADPGERVDDLSAVLAQLGVAELPASPPDPEGGKQEVPPSPELPAALAAAAADPAGLAPAVAAENGNGQGRIFSSPLARRLAKERGLELAQIVGTDPGDRIVRKDVETAQAAAAASPPELPSRDNADLLSRDEAEFTEMPH